MVVGEQERSGKSLNYGNGGSWQCHLFSVSHTHDRGEPSLTVPHVTLDYDYMST